MTNMSGGARRGDVDLNVLRRRVLTQAGNQPQVSVPTSATSIAVSWAQPEQWNTYGIVATPNWNTTVWVSARSESGATINFGSAAPANATVDILTFNSET